MENLNILSKKGSKANKFSEQIVLQSKKSKFN
jgi:hypothetical protein